MGIRPPKTKWDWLLLCSPALVIWGGTAIGVSIPGDNEGGLLGGLFGCFVAGVICLVAGFVFTMVNPKWVLRAVWILIVSVIAAALNFGIAFAGCGLVMR